MLCRGISRLCVFPVYLIYSITHLIFLKENIFQGYSQLFSLVPGIVGEYLRREFYRLTLKLCSPNCCISFGTIFSTNDVEIGENVYIGAYCIIGHARLEKNVLISSHVSIISGTQQHGIEKLNIPILKQKRKLKVVRIGEDCWIGEGAIISADVGKKSVVASGSVVFKKVLPFSIMMGNPARLVRRRGQK